MSFNIVSIDVEDYFNVTNLRNILPQSKWSECPTYVERDTRKILEILDWRHTKATFFVLGWVAEKFPRLVKMIHSRGHEIACHSYTHRLVYEMTPEEFHHDTLTAKKILEDIVGEPVLGYRAPSFSIIPSSHWAYPILMDLGFKYSSSSHPIRHDNYGNPNGLTQPHVVSYQEKKLFEIPISTFQMAGQNIPFSGGGYLRLIPYGLISRAIRSKNANGELVVIYLHPWEINPDQPRYRVALSKKFRHYINLATTDRKFWKLVEEFQCQSMRAFIEGIEQQAGGLKIDELILTA